MSNSNYKTYFCKDAFAKHVVKIVGRNPFTEGKGAHVRRCPRSDCYGAHYEEEMRIRPHIRKFESLDFSKLDLQKYNQAIFTVLNEAVGKVQDAELARKLMKFKSMNFVERLQLWVELYFWSAEQKKAGKKNYPRFSIENASRGIVEDYMWALERLTHMCPQHMEVKRKISTKDRLTIHDTCLGGYNCKFGAHYPEQLVNTSDLLTGVSDDPITLEKYQQSVDEFDKVISDLTSRIEDMKKTIENRNADGFKTTKSRKQKNLEEKISKFKKLVHFKTREKKHIPRSIHLTEKGLIPCCVYEEKERIAKEAMEKKLEEKQDVSKKTRRKVVKKPKM